MVSLAPWVGRYGFAILNLEQNFDPEVSPQRAWAQTTSAGSGRERDFTKFRQEKHFKGTKSEKGNSYFSQSYPAVDHVIVGPQRCDHGHRRARPAGRVIFRRHYRRQTDIHPGPFDAMHTWL